MNDIVTDIFNANIYVMTPKGRVIDLPQGSTPIDFAYRVHTEVGHQAVGAIVNDALVPLNTSLKTGDVVSIRTNKNSGPSEDWMKFVKTNNAKNKIRAFLQKKEEQEKLEDIKNGEQILREDMKRKGLDPDEYCTHKKLQDITSYFQASTVNDLFYSVACKSLSTSSIIEKLVKSEKKEISESSLSMTLEKNQAKRRNSSGKTDVYVKGIDSMKMMMGECCKPIYGDEIIGYVSKGNGIKVHRKDCPNVKTAGARLIDVYWNEDHDSNIKYETDIRIYSKDRSFLLSDLVTVIAQYKATMLGVNVNVNQDDLTATATIKLVVSDLEHLHTIMANLKKVESVIEVERIIK